MSVVTTPEAHVVHGMGVEPAEPDWPVLTGDEVGEVLRSYPEIDGDSQHNGLDASLLWLSPRPLSAAALVRTGSGSFFVKRHHATVRSAASLAEEHAFLGHLRSNAKHLTVVPSPGTWYFFERGEVEPSGRQDIHSMIAVPSKRLAAMTAAGIDLCPELGR